MSTDKNFKNPQSKPDGYTLLAAVPSVCLAWATRVRHIAVDGQVICETKRKTSGYSVNNGQYNSISLSGLPDYPKEGDDVKYTHTDGLIEFKPLDQQKMKISTRSICKKCLSKYEQLLARHCS
jgi:hypothetical protein